KGLRGGDRREGVVLEPVRTVRVALRAALCACAGLRAAQEALADPLEVVSGATLDDDVALALAHGDPDPGLKGLREGLSHVVERRRPCPRHAWGLLRQVEPVPPHDFLGLP